MIGYHPLTSDTGQTPERRREEARDILYKHGLKDVAERGELPSNAEEFVLNLDSSFDITDDLEVSPKQLLWLRDLKAKFID